MRSVTNASADCTAGDIAFHRSQMGSNSAMPGPGPPPSPARRNKLKIWAPEPRCESTWAIDQSVQYDGPAASSGPSSPTRCDNRSWEETAAASQSSMVGGAVTHSPSSVGGRRIRHVARNSVRRNWAPGRVGRKGGVPFLRQRNGEAERVIHFGRRRRKNVHLRRVTWCRQALVSSVGTRSGAGGDAATAWGDTSG
jgi:hypothetical protein